MTVRQSNLPTPRQFLMLMGFGVLFVAGLELLSVNPIDKGIGVFLFVMGLLLALSNNLKGARKEVQKVYKTFAGN